MACGLRRDEVMFSASSAERLSKLGNAHTGTISDEFQFSAAASLALCMFWGKAPSTVDECQRLQRLDHPASRIFQCIVRKFAGDRSFVVDHPSAHNQIVIANGFVDRACLEILSKGWKTIAKRLLPLTNAGVVPVLTVLRALSDVVCRPCRTRTMGVPEATSWMRAILNTLSDAIDLRRFDDWLEHASFIALGPPMREKRVRKMSSPFKEAVAAASYSNKTLGGSRAILANMITASASGPSPNGSTAIAEDSMMRYYVQNRARHTDV